MKINLVKCLSVLGLAAIIGACAGTNETNYLQRYTEFTEDGVVYSQCTAAYPTGYLGTSAIRMDKIVPKQALVGREYRYRFVVTNLRGQDLTNVVITDELPPNLKIVSSEPAKASITGNTAKWILPKLKGHEKITINVVGTAPSVGTISSCGFVSYDDQVCATTEVVEAGLLAKVTAPRTAGLCDIIPLVYTVTNIGSIPLSNVVIDGGKTSQLVALDGTRGGQMEVGNLQPGESKQINVNARATEAGDMWTIIRGVSGNVVSEDARALTVVSSSVLQATITGPDMVIAGRPATYELNVTNTGNGIANNVVVTVPVPGGTQFVSATNGGAIDSAGKDSTGYITWPAANIPAGGSFKANFTLIPNTTASYTVTVTAKDSCDKPAQGSVTTAAKGVAAIHLSTIDEPDPVQVGNNVVYTISALNQGFAKDTNIRIRCSVSDLGEIVAVDGDTKGTFDANTATFEPLPVLDPKQRATWRVTVKAKQKGEKVFKTFMKSDQFGTEVGVDEPTTFY